MMQFCSFDTLHTIWLLLGGIKAIVVVLGCYTCSLMEKMHLSRCEQQKQHLAGLLPRNYKLDRVKRQLTALYIA
jgi:hypothetical protein